jgi:hypothetical protein
VEAGSASENASSKADAHSDRKTGIELLQNMRGRREHDPEKWRPVFRTDHAQTGKSMIRKSGDRFSEQIMLKRKRA